MEQYIWDNLTDAEKAELEALETPLIDPMDMITPFRFLGKNSANLLYRTVESFGKKKASDIFFKRALPKAIDGGLALGLNQADLVELHKYLGGDGNIAVYVQTDFCSIPRDPAFLLDLYFDLRRKFGTHANVLRFLKSVKVLSEEGSMAIVDQILSL
jgi:hypothetical protein